MEFYTDEYEFAHGRAPRGRGGWAFVPADKASLPNYLDYVFWAPSGTYREAKAAAKAHFSALGVDAVAVCS